jgi:hypothetical protein
VYNILFDILKSINIPDTLLKAIMDRQIKFNSKSSKLAEINRGVCQVCPLLPTLFNICLDEIITRWHKEHITGIALPKNKQLLTLLLADDQVIIFNTEDNIQQAAHKLNQIPEYGLTISVQKTK